MQTVLLCGVPSSETHWLVILDQFLLRIKEPDVSDAISLSLALKRPERSVGGITDSRASNFTDGSTRVYISVVCMCAWPSHSETFRRSLVACRTVRAQVWRLCLWQHRRHYLPFLTMSRPGMLAPFCQ